MLCTVKPMLAVVTSVNQLPVFKSQYCVIFNVHVVGKVTGIFTRQPAAFKGNFTPVTGIIRYP